MGRLFGTDGVRGIANMDLTCELALRIGRAAAMVLSGEGRRRPLVIVGKDTRTSSDMLECALTAGLCSVGADVLAAGVVPTPAVAYLVEKYKADAGVMISASHNTAEYNGIKVFGGDGHKLPDALEEQIESIVIDRAQTGKLPTGQEVGKVLRCPKAVKDYVDHLTSSAMYSLDGMKIAVDCANGSASATAGKLFTDLGAEADILFDSPDGENINKGCGSTHLEFLQSYVREHGLEAGVAFDGDADRCLMVDAKGSVIDGDFILAICALDRKQRGKLAKNALVGTVMTNMGLGAFCEENGIKFVATKVGDRFVLEEMEQEEYSLGGEQSGHIIFRDIATTGDGQLTAVQLLSLMKRSGKTLEELASVMTRYPQAMENITVSKEGKLAFYTDPEIKAAVEKAKQELGKNGRIVVRASGTEPLIRVMAEGKDIDEITRVLKETAEVVKQRLAEK